MGKLYLLEYLAARRQSQHPPQLTKIMTHFGIICPPATGHLNTILPLAQELQKRNHRVTLFGILDTKAQTVAAGVEFQAIGEQEFPLGSVEAKNSKVGVLTGKNVREYALQWRQKLVPVLLEEGIEIIKNARIQALLVDHKSKEGGTVAEVLKIPFITICSALVSENYGQVKFQDPIQEVVNEYRHKFNLLPYSCDREFYSPLAQISHQPKEFDLPRTRRTALPKCFHFTGPYHTSVARNKIDFPWSKLTGKPLIYASLGTIQNRQVEIFQGIAKACKIFDIQLIISLGGGLEVQSLPPLPGDPLVVSYAPQLEILKKATLIITNAGLNSTLEALNYGVPIIAIPISYEQPNIASRLVWKGVAEALPIDNFKVDKLENYIAKILDHNSYKQKALNLQAAIINSGGVNLAGDIIEEAIATGKPVLRQKKSSSHNSKVTSSNKIVVLQPPTPDDEHLPLLEKIDFQPIFILGFHRSGTTLLYQILTATQCFNFVSAYHVIKYQELLTNYVNKQESKAKQELAELFQSLGISDRVIDKIPVTPDLPEEYGFILRNAGYEFKLNGDNLDYFKQLCKKIELISPLPNPLLLKNPWDFSNFLYIKKAFPQAKIIFIHRNPTHVINSKLKAGKALFNNPSAYSALISKQYVRNLQKNSQNDQQDNLWYEEKRLRNLIDKTLEESTYFLQNIEQLSTTDYLSIRYEDICQNPEENIQEILGFLNLESKVNLDYPSLISPRPLQFLPQVEKASPVINDKLKDYFEYHQYRSC